MNDKISVIVPAYNIADYIENTIQSICEQTYPDLEIIIVDDGSQDKTSEIVDKLSEIDKRIKVIHKKNGGVSSARFCGIEAATGQWIGFVDGDDYIEPQMYEILMSNAVKYQADISHCGYQMVYPSRVDLYYGTGKVVEQDNQSGIKDLLEGKFIEPGLWNKLFRKNLFDELLQKKLFDMSIKINEDLLMNYFLFQQSRKSVFIDTCYYHYILRRGSAATSQINENKLKDPLKVLKILQKETEDNKEIWYVVNTRIISKLISISTMESKGQKDLIVPYRIEIRKELRRMIHDIINGPYSNKIKFVSIWVSIWPTSYRWVHTMYAKVCGIDKKYEVR